jgi:hypothetical protein
MTPSPLDSPLSGVGFRGGGGGGDRLAVGGEAELACWGGGEADTGEELGRRRPEGSWGGRGREEEEGWGGPYLIRVTAVTM